MSNAVAERQHSPLTIIGDYLSSETVRKQLALALPKHLTVDRLIRIALSSARKSQKLMQCTPQSIGAALQRASETGLEPDGWYAHLVPYKNGRNLEAQYMVDYKGYIRLAYQSGMVKSCAAFAVRAKDKFAFKYGTGAFVDHTPADEEDRGPLTHAWAMAELKEGGAPFIVLNRSEVMAHKKSSTSADSGYSPWNGPHEAAMWAKTAFRVLAKFIPLSSEMASALAAEDEIDYANLEPAVGSGARAQVSDLNARLNAPDESYQAHAESDEEREYVGEESEAMDA